MLIQIPDPNCSTLLLNQMTLLQIPLQRHINTSYPYIQFRQTNQNITNLLNTIHKEIHNFIKTTYKPFDLYTMIKKFYTYQKNLLNKALKCNEPLNEYSHPPRLSKYPHQELKKFKPQISTHTLLLGTYHRKI